MNASPKWVNIQLHLTHGSWIMCLQYTPAQKCNREKIPLQDRSAGPVPPFIDEDTEAEKKECNMATVMAYGWWSDWGWNLAFLTLG